MPSVTNPGTSEDAMAENIAIAASMIVNSEGKYIYPIITIEQAVQIARLLWIMGYRKSAPEAVFQVQI